MNTEPFSLQLITRAFIGGAQAAERAEVRAASIRGQLRWWFRVLGGFGSLAPQPQEDQEAEIFGSAAGNSGKASKLTIRVLPVGRKLPSSEQAMARQGVDQLPNEKYLLWPMAQRIDGEENPRAFLQAGTHFELLLSWRGDPALWNKLLALMTVFGNLGALGYRGRRAQGALAFANPAPMSLPDALLHFPNYLSRITIRRLSNATDASDATRKLATWLKQWREHGRSPGYLATDGVGFAYALRDHHEGYEKLTGIPLGVVAGIKPHGVRGETLRSAVGLPMEQRFGSLQGNKCQWFPKFEPAKRNHNQNYNGDGRFASPIILRPHLDDLCKWGALILFVDIYAWNTADLVYLNGTAKKVSLDLYNAMKLSVPTYYP